MISKPTVEIVTRIFDGCVYLLDVKLKHSTEVVAQHPAERVERRLPNFVLVLVWMFTRNLASQHGFDEIVSEYDFLADPFGLFTLGDWDVGKLEDFFLDRIGLALDAGHNPLAAMYRNVAL